MGKALLSIGLPSNSANYDHIIISCQGSFVCYGAHFQDDNAAIVGFQDDRGWYSLMLEEELFLKRRNHPLRETLQHLLTQLSEQRAQRRAWCLRVR